jgi:serine/threonine protein kinase
MSTHPPTLSKPSVPASGTDHDALPPGTRFGEFEIIRVLGVGGFGIVYLAQDHSLEREVALKEYMPASLAARGAGPQITVRSSSFAETYAIGLRSFINEARLLARFDHPSLVKVYRFWEDNATAYMVMPFLQGTTLRDTRRAMAHPPDEAWIRSVLSPILSALELLHREGVYHRDIAPDNILLPREGPPVLLDFGAARRVISDRTQSLTAILKPSYAPIEQYAEMTQLRQGPWTDIYALGAVVHYLLFGTPPAPATARAVQDDGDAIETRIVPGVSPRFLETMSWMLAIRPNQRPQSGEQLRAVLDGVAEIPPRGRPGITIPGALAPAAPQIEQTADATRINTAYLPTHMPTARVAPAAPGTTTSFSPATSMPTARVTPPAGAAVVPAAAPQRAASAAAGVEPSGGQPRTATPAAPRPAAAAGSTRGPATAPAALERTAAKGAPPSRAAPPVDASRARAQPPAAATSQPSGFAAQSSGFAASQPGGFAPSKPSGFAPSQSSGFAPSQPAGFAPSQSSGFAPSRSPALSSADRGAPHSRPAVTEPPPMRAAPPAGAAAGARASGSKRWLALAGGGVVAAIAAAAALQLSARHDGPVSEESGAASAAASSVVAAPTAPPAAAATTAESPILIEQAAPKTATVEAAPPVSDKPAAESALGDNDKTLSRPGSERSPIVDPSSAAASAARVRPAGKPVPKVGEDGALLPAPGTGLNARPPESPGGYGTTPTPNTDRSRLTPSPLPGSYAAPRPAAPSEGGPQGIEEVCGKLGFFARNVCFDEHCEEARFRNSGVCPEVLARKARRGGR